jgi:hypothetical protein
MVLCRISGSVTSRVLDVCIASSCYIVKESEINRCRAAALSTDLFWCVFSGYGMNGAKVMECRNVA